MLGRAVVARRPTPSRSAAGNLQKLTFEPAPGHRVMDCMRDVQILARSG
jgi:hypothetical protein